MAKLESWVALGSLGMGIMFVALMISFYFFLIGPQGKGPDVYVDPGGLTIFIISISGAPSLILAGTVIGITRTYQTTFASIILITTAIILITGMVIIITRILPEINEQYTVGILDKVPYIFIIGGLGIVGLGVYSFNKAKGLQQNHLEDEIY
jgi:hypothetical protein